MFKFSVSFATEVEKNRPSHGQRFNRGLCSTEDLKRATGHLSSPTNNVHDLKSPLLSWKTCILVHLNALARKTYLLLCSGFWNVFLSFLLLFYLQNQIVVCRKPGPFSKIFLLKQLKSDWFLVVSFVFSANQKPLIICARVTSFALVLQVCTRVTEDQHSFPSQSELSNFFVYIIILLIIYTKKLNEQGYKFSMITTQISSHVGYLSEEKGVRLVPLSLLWSKDLY